MNEVEFKLALNERLCDLAELFLYQYNPCKIENGACVSEDPNPCCSITRFGKNGCPFWNGKCKLKLIWCKNWLCEIAIRNTVPECVDSLKDIEQIGKRFGLIGRPFLGEKYKGRELDLVKLNEKKDT